MASPTPHLCQLKNPVTEFPHLWWKRHSAQVFTCRKNSNWKNCFQMTITSSPRRKKKRCCSRHSLAHPPTWNDQHRYAPLGKHPGPYAWTLSSVTLATCHTPRSSRPTCPTGPVCIPYFDALLRKPSPIPAVLTMGQVVRLCLSQFPNCKMKMSPTTFIG